MRGWKLDYLTQYKDKWWADVNMVMKPNFLYNVDFLLVEELLPFQEWLLCTKTVGFIPIIYFVFFLIVSANLL